MERLVFPAPLIIGSGVVGMINAEKSLGRGIFARFVMACGKRLLDFFLATLFLIVGSTSIAMASPSVMAASSAGSSVETAQRVSKVLSHLLLQANITFKGQIRLVNQPGFNAAAVFTAPACIQIDESYADGLSDGELTFVLSHELAHLLGDHSQRLQRFHAKKTPEYSDVDEIRLHHELELDADRTGVNWTLRAGFSASDAATALERAYNGAQQAFNTHPAAKDRASALFLLSPP